MNWNAFRAYLIARAKEGTTWAGLILVATAAAGASMTPEYVTAVQGIGIALAGAVQALSKS